MAQGISVGNFSARSIISACEFIAQRIAHLGVVSASIVGELGAVAEFIDLGGYLAVGVVFRLRRGAVGVNGFQQPAQRVVLVLGSAAQFVDAGRLVPCGVVL